MNQRTPNNYYRFCGPNAMAALTNLGPHTAATQLRDLSRQIGLDNLGAPVSTNRYVLLHALQERGIVLEPWTVRRGEFGPAQIQFAQV